MKQLIKTSLMLVLTSVFLVAMEGCKEKKTEEHHHHDDETALQLDGGKRWVANAETTQGIQAMIKLSDDYLANPSTELSALKENLKAEFTGIFKKCTMKGEAHNQLHNFLLPLKEKLETLDSSGDVQTIENIKLYLETYKNYFE